MNAQGWGEQLYRHRSGIVLGAVLGLFSGGPAGLIFGALVGYGVQNAFSGFRPRSLRPRQLFFDATFATLGAIAKADGRVSESEIQFAQAVMQQMKLDEKARARAIERFTQGKAADFDLEACLRPLARLVRHQASVKQMFLEIQLQAALVDGDLSGPELALIQKVCTLLEVDFGDLEKLLRRIRAEQAFRQGAGSRAADSVQALSEAYAVLGVSGDASNAEVKRAYRRLMSQHHPDKLVAHGLPAEMMQLAKEKTQEIQSAYDRIRSARADGY